MIILHTFVRHNVDNIAMNMDLSLSNFEQQIDGTILKRGFDYFKKGYVTEVEDLGDLDLRMKSRLEGLLLVEYLLIQFLSVSQSRVQEPAF